MNDDLRERILLLSKIMKNQARSTDSQLLENGRRCLAIYNDTNFGASIPKYEDYMRDLYLEAAVDLSNGAALLRHYVMGVCFRNGRLTRFSIPLGSSQDMGTLVCSVRLKHEQQTSEDPANSAFVENQEVVNAGVYLLCFLISRI
jgi:hypothetical protein